MALAVTGAGQAIMLASYHDSSEKAFQEKCAVVASTAINHEEQIGRASANDLGAFREEWFAIVRLVKAK